MLRIQFVVAGSALALLAGAASGTVILYDNFGSGDTYDPGTGWTVSVGPPVNTKFEPGFAFTVAGGNFMLTTVDFAVGHVTGTNAIRLHLYDSVGGFPGTVLQTVEVGGFGSFGDLNPASTADFGGQTKLLDGEEYFLVAEAVGPEAWLAWNWNNTGANGMVLRIDGGDWLFQDSPSPVARVFGKAQLPAPGALALLTIGGLLGTRRRRN